MKFITFTFSHFHFPAHLEKKRIGVHSSAWYKPRCIYRVQTACKPWIGSSKTGCIFRRHKNWIADERQNILSCLQVSEEAIISNLKATCYWLSHTGRKPSASAAVGKTGQMHTSLSKTDVLREMVSWKGTTSAKKLFTGSIGMFCYRSPSGNPALSGDSGSCSWGEGRGGVGTAWQIRSQLGKWSWTSQMSKGI